MIKFDEFVFKKVVKVGSILKVLGRVKLFGNSLLELYMEVCKYNVYMGE